MKISFIIPVYKVEAYLRQCVESLTCQTYRDIEIVLVDDGSPDGSPQLCDALASEDSRIRIIHKENGGLSDARNAGLLVATGDYVVFVDGDDFWMDNKALRQLIDVLNSEMDFIGYNCSYFYPDSKTFAAWVPYNESISKPIDKNTAMIALVKSGTFPMSACLKLMKRSFLMDNKLFFKKGQIAEDIPWFINVLDSTKLCCFVNEYIYAYRQNVFGSISSNNNRRSFDSLFDIFKTELVKIEQRSFSEEAKAAIKSFLAYEYCILLTYTSIEKQTRNELRSYQSVLKYDMNPKVKKASRCYKLFGIKITTLVLSTYQWIRRRRK